MRGLFPYLRGLAAALGYKFTIVISAHAVHIQACIYKAKAMQKDIDTGKENNVCVQQP